MNDNLPILYRNVMDGLPSQLAKDAFLWATERPGEDRMCYRAERFARDVHAIACTLRYVFDKSETCGLRAAAKGIPTRLMDAEQRASLEAFILTRHANHTFGGNVHPSYAVAA